MENLFPIYFETLDNLLSIDYDGKFTPEFKKLVNATRVKLKDTFLISSDYQKYCLIIDTNFDNYIKERQ